MSSLLAKSMIMNIARHIRDSFKFASPLIRHFNYEYKFQIDKCGPLMKRFAGIDLVEKSAKSYEQEIFEKKVFKYNNYISTFFILSSSTNINKISSNLGTAHCSTSRTDTFRGNRIGTKVFVETYGWYATGGTGHQQACPQGYAGRNTCREKDGQEASAGAYVGAGVARNENGQQRLCHQYGVVSW